MAAIRQTAEAPPPSGADPATGSHHETIGQSVMRKAAWRLIPVIAIGYGLAYMDRASVSFAALRMNQDLHFSATVYGFGAGLFFIGNAASEVPSNLLLLRFGAKRVLAAIMFAWGLIATAMMLVRTPMEFYALRLLLGVAEAGFYPGVLYYLTLWFPARMRARAVSRFYIALPLSSVVMGSLAGWLMGLDGRFGLSGLAMALPRRRAARGPLHRGHLQDAARSSRPGFVAYGGRKGLAQASSLSQDDARAHLGHEAGVLAALRSPKVWSIGLFFFFVGVCGYGFAFSAPAILQNATGWSVGAGGLDDRPLRAARRRSHAAERSSLRPQRRPCACTALCPAASWPRVFWWRAAPRSRGWSSHRWPRVSSQPRRCGGRRSRCPWSFWPDEPPPPVSRP